jgi:hypothetical protein
MANPFSKLAELQARARAIKSGASSVPTVNGESTSSLALGLARCAAAEANLESARVTARAAARREGVKISGLFSESQFVMRGTAERWTDEARAEGHEQGAKEITAAYKMMLAPPSGVFAALAVAVRKAIAAGGFKDILGRDKGGAPGAADDPDAAEVAEQARIMAEAKILAEKILAAGERARSDGSNERPEPTGKAKRILDTAAKAHRRGDD